MTRSALISENGQGFGASPARVYPRVLRADSVASVSPLASAASSSPAWWLAIVLAIIPAGAAIAAAVTASHYARASKTSELDAQRIRDLESRISDRKYDTYRPLIVLLGDLLNGETRGDAVAQGPTKLREFATWISIYGSDEAIRVFGHFMQASFNDAPPVIFLRLYCEFVLAARRDIGYPDTQASPLDVLAMRVNDLFTPEGMRWAVTEPFDAVCERVGWVPPWLLPAGSKTQRC